MRKIPDPFSTTPGRRATLLVALATAFALALALALALPGCGSGSDDGAAPPPDDSGDTPSTDQIMFEASEARMGQATLSWSIPARGGLLQSPDDFIAAVWSGGLADASAAPGDIRTQSRRKVSLASALALPGRFAFRVVQDGAIVSASDTSNVRIRRVGDAIGRDVMADNGRSVMWSERLSGFRSTSLSGPLAASPAALLAAVPLHHWSASGNLASVGAWQPGAAFLVRRTVHVGDTVYVSDCDIAGAGSFSPCPTSATSLEAFLPHTFASATDHPIEINALADGTIRAVQGVRMWVADKPRPMILGISQRYRVYFELDGAIHAGTLMKDGTQVNFQQADGTVVDYTTTLNGAAVDSIAASFIVAGSGGDGSATAEVAGPTVDLIGLGAHGINGSLAPSDLRRHYGIPATATGAGQVVAIVAGQGSGNPQADLNAWSRFHGLPECDAANPCFDTIDRTGGAGLAPDAIDWATEIAIDVQMVHAIAPQARIILVLAGRSAAQRLAAASYAATLPGVTVVSMSFSALERPIDISDNGHFSARPGVVYLASSGDVGHGARFPAASPWVTAVGGTRLHRLAWSAPPDESAWPFGGGGTSTVQAMPAWQADYFAATGQQGGNGQPLAAGAYRVVPDVSAVADLRSGFGIFRGQSWATVSGTSVATPLWAGIAALIGEQVSKSGRSLPAMMSAAAPLGGGFSALLYQTARAHPAAFRDVVSGSNDLGVGSCDECTAQPGFDALTGLGSPDVAALLAAF